MWPGVVHFFRRIKPAYQKHYSRLYGFFADQIQKARVRAKELGAEAAVEMADNTLDMMVSRELRGEDWMSDKEMQDEMFLCEWAAPSDLNLEIRLRHQSLLRPNRLGRGHRDFCNDSLLGG